MSISFKVIQKSKKSRARLGLLETSHGVVETPAFVPVATQATIKTLTAEETLAAGSQLLISNTFHLHLKPGEKIVKANGGLHKFMNWSRPLMTDSGGGFQVFSLGFGRDMGVGKVLKYFPGRDITPVINEGAQSKSVKITPDGVDTFDCIVPTHYARRGIAFITKGAGATLDDSKLNLTKSAYLKDQKPLDPKCTCQTCRNYSRSFICHLIKAREITGLRLITFHNLFYFNQHVANIREKIKRGKL